MHSIQIRQPVQPWYREPWPWLIMLGPAVVIVAGIITTVIAFRTSDGLVADDYYKQGLAMNKTLARDREASRRQLAASGAYVPPAADTSGKLRVMLTGDSAAAGTIQLRLAHPTRAGQDRLVTMKRLQAGVYEGALDVPVGNLTAGGRWLVTLEQDNWRLTGEWTPGTVMRLSSTAQH